MGLTSEFKRETFCVKRISCHCHSDVNISLHLRECVVLYKTLCKVSEGLPRAPGPQTDSSVVVFFHTIVLFVGRINTMTGHLYRRFANSSSQVRVRVWFSSL